MRMLELRFGKSFVVIDDAIPDELNLRYTRDSFEIRMKDRLFGLLSLIVAVAIALRLRVEGLKERMA